MKRRRFMQSMLVSDRGGAPYGLGVNENVDVEAGVRAVTLSGTVGGLRPISLRVGAAPPPIGTPTLDDPIAPVTLGDHALDRIGRGFFSVQAQNPVELSYSTEGISEENTANILLDLGADYQGSVSIRLGTKNYTRTVSGSVGERFPFLIPGSVAILGKLTLTASADGFFRLLLNGSRDEGEGLSLTLLAYGEDGKDLSEERILLPAPLYALPSGRTDELLVCEGRSYVSVGHAEITSDTPFSLLAETASAAAPVFTFSVFGNTRGEGEILASHGIVGIDDAGVLSGEQEGLSLLSDDPDKLVFALTRERLTGDALSIKGVRLDDVDSVGSVNAPTAPDFYPWGGYDHYTEGLYGNVLHLVLPEPLRLVGPYADRVYLNLRRQLALSVRRIGRLSLSGDEEMTFRHFSNCSRVSIPFSGGQMSSPQNDLVQLCTHGEASGDTTLRYPERAGELCCYLTRSSLEIALGKEQPFSESEQAFRALLREHSENRTPFTCYYPLAEPCFELIPLEIFDGDPSVYEGDDPAMLYPTPIDAPDAEALEALARLWIAGQRTRPSVLYPLAEPFYRTVETSGALRLPDRKTTVTVVEEVKPVTLSLWAAVYPEEAASSTANAAGSEDS